MNRPRRNHQVIYGEGKTPEQLLAILKSMGARRRQTEAGGGRNATTTTPATGIILATRVSAEKYAALRALMAAGEEGVLEVGGCDSVGIDQSNRRVVFFWRVMGQRCMD